MVIPVGSSITVTHSAGADSVNSVVSYQTFMLSGGSLSVANNFETDGALNISGGTLLDAMVETTNGGSLVVNGAGGTLDGVTVNGTLDVGNSVSGAGLTVTDGLTLNGTMLLGNPSNSWWGTVSFVGSQVLGGSGTVVFGNHSYANSLLVANGGTTLVIGSEMTVEGDFGWIGYDSPFGRGSSAASVANEGTISADVNGGTIAIAGASFSNQGTLEIQNGGTLSVQDMAGDLNQVSMGEGSALILDGTYVNSLPVNVPSGAFLSLDGDWSNSGSIVQGPGGVLILSGNWNSAVGGGIIQASDGQLNLEGGYTVAMVQSLQLSSNESVY
ncbi:MAG: hypothetical protein ACLQVW_22970, partial [Limisphaerales bacterium]